MTTLFDECIAPLAGDYRTLTATEGAVVTSAFEYMFPIASWGRIDWEKMNGTTVVQSLADAQINFHNFVHLAKPTIFIMWDNGKLPILQADITKALAVLNDLRDAGFTMWLFSIQAKRAIEFYGVDDIKVGVGSDMQKKLLDCYEQVASRSIDMSAIQDEFHAVALDIIAKGNIVRARAQALLNHEKLSIDELDSIHKQYVANNAWRMTRDNVVPLVKAPEILAYAKALEKLQDCCKGMIAYNDAVNIEMSDLV